MNRLIKRYFVDENGKKDELAGLINCYEQILYQALCDYKIDYYLVFCDDISLCVNENNPQRLISMNNLYYNKDLFYVDSFEQDWKDAFTSINNAIDNNITVSICTMFDKLPPYHWYNAVEKRGKSNTHFCLYVGYDKNDYYFAENPDMIKKERFVAHPVNPTLGVISKEILLDAFKDYCKIMTVRINTAALSKIDKFELVKNTIIKNYYCNQHSEKTYIGRKAIKILIEKIINTTIVEDYIVNDYFTIYLMYARRSILLHCIKIKKSLYNESKISKLVDILGKSIIAWKVLYRIVAKHTVKRNIDINSVLVNNLHKIIILEDELINSLQEI